MNTNNITNRMKELENRLGELAKSIRRKYLYTVRECIPMYEFKHGTVKEAKVEQGDYGWKSLAVKCLTRSTVTSDGEIKELEHKTFYYPLYKDYEELHVGQVLDKNDIYKMYMLILTRPGYPVLFRVSLTPEECTDTYDYNALLEEYDKVLAEYHTFAKENNKKPNIFAGLILY